MTIITNHHWRPLVDACELTARERAQFDYHDWDAIDDGRDSATFVRYRGELHDLGCFERGGVEGWDGIEPDSAFSGTLIRLSRDGESAQIGRVYS